jgi:hypothetical protein
MSSDRRHQPSTRQPPASGGLPLVLAVLLALSLGRAIAADTHATLVQPASTGQAKTTRQALLKQRTSVVGLHLRHPGKTVGGARTPAPKTIVTKRFLPK